jgi:cellulose synthase/poly-beta-1,6-N-acetylglucosamine synthase-like glycosyltransferase
MIKVLVTLLLYSLSLDALTTSIIIPCHYKHVQHLPNLLEKLNEQTVTPDEVVISISEMDKSNPADIEKIFKGAYVFSLEVRMTCSKKSAGQNRNRACELARADIMICQDADDLPHPQRIEIIKYFFENHDINLLIHKWQEDEEPFVDHDVFSAIPFEEVKSVEHYGTFAYVTNGNSAFKRELLSQHHWNDNFIGEDVNFNMEIIQAEGKVFVIDVTLLKYRIFLSSYKD